MDFRFDFDEAEKEEKEEEEETLTQKKNIENQNKLRPCRAHTHHEKTLTTDTTTKMQKYSVGDKILCYFDVDEMETTCIDSTMLSETSHSDLQSGTYEGGFKIWECTYDLLDYLLRNLDLVQNKNVLDLGCGVGLLGAFCCLSEASHVTFQDYNSEVIEHFAMTTVAHTKQNSAFNTTTNFLSGDWDNVSEYFKEQETVRFDLILSSETIYNREYYPKLLTILQNHLSSDGVALFAAKSFYFGVGGGTKDFTEYLINNGRFTVDVFVTTKDGLERQILKVTKNT